ncbi:MAG TPA: PAS domain S-box protein, partial [Candidatus Binatia bacterium]|nr:PAS domain S-box protein [Candidatus Binatia bacterium]
MFADDHPPEEMEGDGGDRDVAGDPANDNRDASTAVDVATLILGRQLRLELSSKAAADLFGVDDADRGQHLSQLMRKIPGYERLVEDAERVLATQVALEHEVTRDDGARFLLRICPCRTMNEEREGLVIMLQDVTLARRTERALALSRDRYRLLAQTAREYALFTMDGDGRIDMWNVGAERITGYSQDEVLGRSGAILFTP